MLSRFIITTVFTCNAIVSFNIHAAPSYSLETLGLYSTEHTRIDGYKYSSFSLLNQAGQATGSSQRFNDSIYISKSDLGTSAWYFNGNATQNIGLTGLEHTRDDGYKYSAADRLNEAGLVLGNSLRFNGLASSLGNSVWLYDGTNTINIGLIDEQHTDTDGYKESTASRLNEAGYVTGISALYNGTGTSLGTSAWLYNGQNTMNIGLIDTEHTRADGFKDSTVISLNESSHVLGSSSRFNGLNQEMGNSIWVNKSNNTINIGLTDTEHTRNDGYKYSYAGLLNQSGHATGISNRYNGSGTSLGSSAWFYDGNQNQKIGLINSEHIRSDGFQFSAVSLLSDSGHVAGSSQRYTANTSQGTSAWLFNGSRTQHIGLTDNEHTRNDGYKHNAIRYLNEAGQVAGKAKRYNSYGTFLGESSWLYDGKRTKNIGLTDIEHTRVNGYKHSSSLKLNSTGKVLGSSKRYNNTDTLLGQSIWLHDGSQTKNIGLIDNEHTRTDNYKSSSANQLNETGQVTGTSLRYNQAGEAIGQSAWIHNANLTQNIGLTDIEHTRSGDYKFNEVNQLNENGQITGYANRYNGSDIFLGQSTWFYDSLTDTTYNENLSTRNSDGYAYSASQYLGEDGLMLGYYTLFDETHSWDLGNRAFGFTVNDGYFDLGMQITGGSDLFNWESLANAIMANDSGQFIGTGQLANMTDGQAIFLATADTINTQPLALPVPASIWLFSSGLIILFGFRKKTFSI